MRRANASGIMSVVRPHSSAYPVHGELYTFAAAAARQQEQMVQQQQQQQQQQQLKQQQQQQGWQQKHKHCNGSRALCSKTF